MQPLIGITADFKSVEKPVNRRHKFYWVKTEMIEAVERAKGSPVIVPDCVDFQSARNIVNRLDGLLISGGDFDIDPAFYGEKREKTVKVINSKRTRSELYLLKAALKEGKPVLGICGGIQLINVYFGGTLYQDIPTQVKKAFNHVQKTHPKNGSHKVQVLEWTRLASITREHRFKVNSTHHQSVKDLGKGLEVAAVSSDGIIEALELTGNLFVIGVQWHPEFLSKDRYQLRIFRSFIKAAAYKD